MIPEAAAGVALVAWLVVSLGVRSALRLAEAGERGDERAAWREWADGVDAAERREAAEVRRREGRGVWSAASPDATFAYKGRHADAERAVAEASARAREEAWRAEMLLDRLDREEAGRDETPWSMSDHLAQLDLEERVVRLPGGGFYIAESAGEDAREEARRHVEGLARRELDDGRDVWMKLHRMMAEADRADQAQDPPDVRR